MTQLTPNTKYTMYQLNAKKKLYEWSIEVTHVGEKVHINTQNGMYGGKMIRREKLIDTSKGGKTFLEQAVQDASRSYLDKRDKRGYTDNKDSLMKFIESNSFVVDKTTGSTKTSSITKGHSTVIRPMLAYKFEFKDLEKKKPPVTFPCYLQRKLDGLRCMSHFESGDIIMESRQGVPFKIFTNIMGELGHLLGKHTNIYLDGEMYTDEIPFQTLSGIIRLKEIPTDLEQLAKIDMIHYYIYDCVVLDNLEMSYKDRMGVLQKLFSKKKYKHLRLLETETITTSVEIKEKHDQYVSDGFEGVMLRNPASPYKIGKRSKDLLKYKEFMEEEFKVIGFTEGTGGDKGTVIWECEMKDNQTFSVRPRGTKEERADLFKNGEKYIGKKLTVIFFGLSTSGIPRFPVGKDIREGY